MLHAQPLMISHGDPAANKLFTMFLSNMDVIDKRVAFICTSHVGLIIMFKAATVRFFSYLWAAQQAGNTPDIVTSSSFSLSQLLKKILAA